MTTAEAGRRHDGVREIDDWVSGYVERHPRASINTVGDQAIMAVRTIQTLFVDLFTGKFGGRNSSTRRPSWPEPR